MKTKYIGLALITLLLFNCDSGSNNSDDDFLNGSNYISENNFYIYALNIQIEEIQVDIDALQAIIDSGMGDANTEEELIAAIDDRTDIEDELNEAFLNNNPVPLDTPPSECPEVLTCFPADAMYLVMHNRFHELAIDIYDDQDDLIFSSSGQTTLELPGVNDYRYIDVTIEGYTGPVTILVDKHDSEENLIDYYITGYAY